MQHHEALVTVSILWVDRWTAFTENPYLERVTAIRFTIYHLHDVLTHRLARLVSISPIVCRTDAILAHVEVLRIVDVLVGPCLYSVYHLQLVSASIPVAMGSVKAYAWL